MKQSFVLHNLRPFSINATYYGGSGFVKTAAAREWTYNVFQQLSDHETEAKFAQLRELFDPKKHGFSVSFTAFYPRAQFFTKAGTISSKTFDLSNCEKGLLDCLFLAKYSLLASPEGCQNLQIDDRYVIKLQSEKKMTDSLEPRIEITIEIIEF